MCINVCVHDRNPWPRRDRPSPRTLPRIRPVSRLEYTAFALPHLHPRAQEPQDKYKGWKAWKSVGLKPCPCACLAPFTSEHTFGICCCRPGPTSLMMQLYTTIKREKQNQEYSRRVGGGSECHLCYSCRQFTLTSHLTTHAHHRSREHAPGRIIFLIMQLQFRCTERTDLSVHVHAFLFYFCASENSQMFNSLPVNL